MTLTLSKTTSMHMSKELFDDLLRKAEPLIRPTRQNTSPQQVISPGERLVQALRFFATAIYYIFSATVISKFHSNLFI
jgi:hypothetical protein